MKWINRLFKRKKKEIYPVDEEEKKYKELYSEEICDACKSYIFSGQKSITKAGKRYHVKPCWRKLQKMAKKEAFG